VFKIQRHKENILQQRCQPLQRPANLRRNPANPAVFIFGWVHHTHRRTTASKADPQTPSAPCSGTSYAANDLPMTKITTPVPLVLAVAAVAVPTTTRACEPILPLTQLIAGSTLTGPLLLELSLLWLAIAVAIKCATFTFLERRLPWSRALLFMLLANVFSTIPGLLTAALAGAVSLIALPIVYGLGVLARRRLSRLPQHPRSHWVIAQSLPTLLTAAFFVSVVMFTLADGALANQEFATYWVLKMVFATTAVSVGMAISAVLEECAVATLAGKAHSHLSFFTPVLRANYITLALVLLVAALQILPKRLSSPHFIVALFHSLSTMLGFA
jgi:hypothetical protein